MNNEPTQYLLSQMHDIQGLAAISGWPPGPGWWILAVLIIGGVFFWIRRVKHARSWKGDALRQLNALEEKIDGGDVRGSAGELSVMLRRIAMKRASRQEAAGLSGQAWLDWLAKNDPRHFDWEIRGRVLLEAPYAPPDRPVLPDQLKDICKAIRAWVK